MKDNTADDAVLNDPMYLRTLLFRLTRAETHPEQISPDERASVLREARIVINVFRDRERNR